MQLLLNTLLIICAFSFCVYFFWKSAGTLNPGKLNVISAAFYLFLVQNFLGAVLIQWGFNHHYTLDYLITRDASINTTFYVVMLTAVAWPLCIFFIQKLFKVNAGKAYKEYLKKPTINTNEKSVFWIVTVAGIVCLGLLVAYLFQIGYVPLLRLFHHPKDFNFSTERIKINQIYIINQYVRNIFILFGIPLISYLCFAFALSTKSIRWIVMAAVFFLLSIVTKTYNFEKSPLLFHMAIYVMICIYFSGGIRALWVALMGCVGFLTLLATYHVVMGSASLDLYNGIIGRTVFTPVGVIAFNFDMFPNVYHFLMGRSAAPTLLKFLHINGDLYLRSARLLMEFYGSQSVFAGTAGVMNTLFIGEAYANYGWAGLAFSVVWVSIVMAGLFWILLKARKTPITIALSAYMTISIATTTQGGFFDFLYNTSWIIAIGGLLLCEYFPDILRYVRTRFTRKKKLEC